MRPDGTVGASGRDPSEVTLEAVRDGTVEIADLSIHPDTLLRQAQVAEDHANPQLAASFRRAAELTRFGDEPGPLLDPGVLARPDDGHLPAMRTGRKDCR